VDDAAQASVEERLPEPEEPDTGEGGEGEGSDEEGFDEEEELVTAPNKDVDEEAMGVEGTEQNAAADFDPEDGQEDAPPDTSDADSGVAAAAAEVSPLLFCLYCVAFLVVAFQSS
jgi:hypothetical protein